MESLGFVAVSVASGLAGLLYTANEAHTLPLVTSLVSIPMVFFAGCFLGLGQLGSLPKAES